MSSVEVTIDLPFFLRLEDPLTVGYEQVCQASQLPGLVGQDVQITFSRTPAGAIDKSEWPLKERSAVAIRLETATPISSDSVNTFAIRNCLEILNRIILSYLATTGEASNAGFITSLGTSYMQLFAEIKVDDEDFRDRWPSQSLNTFPLETGQVQKFTAFLLSKEEWPVRLFHTNAVLSLEQGQYSLAVLQAAMAVELRLTQVISHKLREAGWSDQAIEPYEREFISRKLQMPRTDPRSLETYYHDANRFDSVYKRVRDDLVPLRNRVAHRGHLPGHQDAIEAVKAAREFLRIVS